MSRFLIKTTEVYRVDSEVEATNLIEEAKEDNHFTLVKYNCELKEKKSGGDVVDSWCKVTLIKEFADEKEPEEVVIVSYEVQ
jgi:hypothetical protein